MDSDFSLKTIVLTTPTAITAVGVVIMSSAINSHCDAVVRLDVRRGLCCTCLNVYMIDPFVVDYSLVCQFSIVRRVHHPFLLRSSKFCLYQ